MGFQVKKLIVTNLKVGKNIFHILAWAFFCQNHPIEVTHNLFSPFHLNICSLPKNIDDEEHHLIQSAKADFDIIYFSKSRLIKDKLPSTDIILISFLFQNQD